MNFTSSGFDPLVEDQWKLTAARFQEWVQNELFSVKWWILLAFFLFTAWLWWKKADKKRLPELVLFTVVTSIIIIALDEFGDEQTLWYYPVDIFPLFPPMSAMNMSCLPCAYMLLYQSTKTWKTFLILSGIMSLVFVFIVEPLFIWGGLFTNLDRWESLYGLPIYFLIAVVAKAVTYFTYKASGIKKEA